MISPKPKDKAAGRIGRKLKVIYERVDLTVRNAQNTLGTTCEEGCNHCCYLSVAMSIPEGLIIIDKLSRDPAQWYWLRSQLPQFRKWVEILENRETTRESWFDMRIPCSFLKDDSCSIYDVRPTACRTHVSNDDPFKCSHEADREADVRFLNLHFIDDFVWKEAKYHLKREKLPMGWAPMPAVMIWVYVYWTRGKRGFLKAIEGSALADGDLANLTQWIHLVRSDPRLTDVINQLRPLPLPEKMEIPNDHAESSKAPQEEDQEDPSASG